MLLGGPTLDEPLRDFPTETAENPDLVDVERVHFGQEPANAKFLGDIFRLVHTMKSAVRRLGDNDFGLPAAQPRHRRAAGRVMKTRMHRGVM
ncbi:hypothetical protein [Hansschlegelia plantiphila]|uniref:Uncharacterized protein n=1 Tax=Hansschlegelia plantiphila TaxID=374655 RepID=A0A9W6MVD7_9HYPH|nr:hypothetical protein [Hansschlegelia plantiphila]GLK67781.1 hypothetical protein GCM10008179_14190 [Hansschlegelia plantiphila]